MEKTFYDFKWLQDGMRKREANYSNVICFESGDPFRMPQLKAFLIQNPNYRECDIYYLNGWTGLCRIRKENGLLEPVTRGAGGGYDQGIQNTFQLSRDALTYLDSTMKKRKVALILHDLEQTRPEDMDKDLIQALRHWAYDSEICLSGSTIFLFCRQADLVLDRNTVDRLAIIAPPMANPEERVTMIKEQHERLIGPPSSSLVSLLVQATAGLNLHQIKTVLLESYHDSKTFSVEKIKRLKSDLIERSKLVEIEEPDPAGFDSVGGYEVVKQFVRGNIIKALLEPDRACRFHVRVPRGIILFGPPGTGKTLFARALAKEVQLPFVNFRTENLYSQYLGVSGHNFRDAIEIIDQMSPAIVFIDEIDKLGKRRGEVSDGASEETRRVYNQILEWLGKKERTSILIGTTNRPDDLDEAFRVGRVDYWVPFLYPNRSARMEILKIHLHGTPINGDALESLTRQTEGYSGAELEELVHRANRIAFTGTREHLAPEDLFQALNSFRIDQENRQRQRESYIQMAEDYTNDLVFLTALRGEQ